MTWWDDLPERSAIRGEGRDFISELVDQTDLPDPTHWDRYDVVMDDTGSVYAGIIDDQGVEHYQVIDGIDLMDSDAWDWVWDVWDWIDEYFDWIDEDSAYDQVPS